MPFLPWVLLPVAAAWDDYGHFSFTQHTSSVVKSSSTNEDEVEPSHHARLKDVTEEKVVQDDEDAVSAIMGLSTPS